MAGYNDCVEFAFFEIRVSQSPYWFLLALLPHLQRRLHWVDVHVACVLFEIDAGKELLVCLFIDNVNLTGSRRCRYGAALRLVGGRRGYVLVNSIECRLIICMR